MKAGDVLAINAVVCMLCCCAKLSFEKKIYEQWVAGVDEACSFNLAQPLIVRSEETNFIAVNFDPQVFFQPINQSLSVFSALTLLVGRQEGHPACKNLSGGYWRAFLSGARCRLAYGPADANATHCLLLQ